MKKVEYIKSRSFAGEKTPAKASFLLTLKEDQQGRKGLQYERYPFDLEGGEKKMINKNNNPSVVEKQNFLKVYPNPTSDFTNVEIKLLNENSHSELIIYNSLGSQIERRSVTDKDVLTVNTKDYSKGIYLFLLKTDFKIMDKQKVIISK